MATQCSPARSRTVTIAVIGFTLLTGCASAPVASDSPERISAEASGQETATQAADAARQARPDESDDAQTTRWIYATNTTVEKAGDQPTRRAGEDPDKPRASTEANASPTAAKQHSTPIKILVRSDGSLHGPHTQFETPVTAADWAQTGLSSTGARTVEVYVSRDTDARHLDALLAALRNTDVPHVSIVFGPATNDAAVDGDGNSENSGAQPDDSQ